MTVPKLVKRVTFENKEYDDSCEIERMEFQCGTRSAIMQVIKDNKHRRIGAAVKGFELDVLVLNRGYHLGGKSRSAALADCRKFVQWGIKSIEKADKEMYA